MAPTQKTTTAHRSVAIVIPARYGSTRFPGKPLAMVAGRSLLERTWRIAKAVRGVHGVYVATDDERIARHAESFGAEAVSTPSDCATGTDRVAAAAARLKKKPGAVVNLQGDALLTPPWVLQALVDELSRDQNAVLATPAVRLDRDRYEEFLESKKRSPSSGTTVVLDKERNALYFSKAVIPYVRDPDKEFPPVYRHVGVYGYALDTLKRLTRLPASTLEKSEGLEQLRALENGIPIRVVVVDYRGRTHWSVDAPEDVRKAEEIIRREGELTP